MGKIKGVIRANIALVIKNKNINAKGWKQFIGKMSSLRTEEKGKINIGRALYLSDRCTIGAYKGGELSIGDNNFFNMNCNIACYKKICIGNNNLFGPNVVIVDHNHRYDMPDKLICKQGYNFREVTIGSDCWICANVVITPGTKIGDHIVIGANAVVSGDLSTPGVYAGIPAKLIKKRD